MTNYPTYYHLQEINSNMSLVTKSYCTGRWVLTLFLQFSQLTCSKTWYGLVLIYIYIYTYIYICHQIVRIVNQHKAQHELFQMVFPVQHSYLDTSTSKADYIITFLGFGSCVLPGKPYTLPGHFFISFKDVRQYTAQSTIQGYFKTQKSHY